MKSPRGRDTRFQPGASGNPRGRPKGRKNFRTEIEAELNRKILVSENGRKRRMTRQSLIVRRLIADALQGDGKAREQVLRLLWQIAPNEPASVFDPAETAKDAEILARFRAELLSELKGTKA